MLAPPGRSGANSRLAVGGVAPSEPSVNRFEVAARASGLERGAEYHMHRLDLRPQVAEIFGRMHHSSTQRAVRRAEREGLTYETGTSDRLLASFYRLLRMTRRRHGLPPQPFAWFRNLVSCLGQRVAIHAAVNKDGERYREPS